MIDYSKWKQVTKTVTSLQLDSRNPRLLPRSIPPTQPELITELVNHEGVYDLAKSIAERGFYRVELPIAVEEGGKLIIVEGNRRLTALKLLISPNLSPESMRSKFKKLSHKTVISEIKKIMVTVAPSRDAAAPIILSKHTRREINSWEPVMQARFYADRIADGATIAELTREYAPITQGQIVEFLQNYQMYQVACNLDLPADVAAKVRDPREFPLSTLERVYRNSDASEFLGIGFDSHRQLKVNISMEEFNKSFGKVVSDVALGKVTSRNLNTKAEFDKYLKGFGKLAPDKTKKGSFSAATILGVSAAKASMPKHTPVTPNRPKRSQVSLISTSFTASSNDHRINDILKELKKISAKDYPNAVAFSLRSLLDLIVGDYCDRIGATAKIIARARSKENKPADWYPSVRQMLNYTISNSTDLVLHPLALKAAKMLVTDDSKGMTVLALDAFAHNKYVTPTEPELRSFWTQIEEVIKEMLPPPQTFTQSKNGGIQ